MFDRIRMILALCLLTLSEFFDGMRLMDCSDSSVQQEIDLKRLLKCSGRLHRRCKGELQGASRVQIHLITEQFLNKSAQVFLLLARSGVLYWRERERVSSCADLRRVGAILGIMNAVGAPELFILQRSYDVYSK